MFDLSQMIIEADEERSEERIRYYQAYVFNQTMKLQVPRILNFSNHKILEIPPVPAQQANEFVAKLDKAAREMKVKPVEPFVIDFPPIT